MKKKRKIKRIGKYAKKPKKYDLSKMSPLAIERLSYESALKVKMGKDNLKSRGKCGIVKTRFGLLHHRSNLEKGVYIALEKTPFVNKIKTEPVIIPYQYHGLKHHYVPDILIKMTDGRVWLIEVKPKSQIKEEKNIAKFHSATKWCKGIGNHLRFGVITSIKKETIQKFLLTHDGKPLDINE